MNTSISITPRRLTLIGLLGLVAVITYGFAAANTVPATNAGDGQAAISGYTVTNVHYALDSTTPTNVSSLTFTLTPGLAAGGAVRISIDGGTNWLPACTSSGPGATSNVTCNSTVAVTALGTLRVVAAQ